MTLSMKKLAIVIATLACIQLEAANAAERWTRIFSDSDMTLYIDTSSIRPQGQYLKAWLLMSKQSPIIAGKIQFKSVVSLEYFDCSNMTRAAKQLTYHPDVNGTEEQVGSTFFDDRQLIFKDAAPTSGAENALRIVCARKR